MKRIKYDDLSPKVKLNHRSYDIKRHLMMEGCACRSCGNSEVLEIINVKCINDHTFNYYATYKCGHIMEWNTDIFFLYCNYFIGYAEIKIETVHC